MSTDGSARARLAGFALAAAGAALFSTKAIFIKLAYAEVADAPLMLTLRMLMSLPFFLVVRALALRSHGNSGRPLPRQKVFAGAVLNGLVGYYLSSLLDFEGLIYITAQLERLVLFTYPIFVMLLGWLFFGGRLTKEGLIGAAVTYFGLAVVFRGASAGEFWPTAIGTVLVLMAAFAFALYQLLAKQLIADLGSTLFTAIAMSSAAVAITIHFLVTSGGMVPHLSSRYLLLVAATAMFATVVPSFLINAGLARIGPQSTAMISTLSPLVTIYLAIAFLGERFTLIDAIGTVFIIGGVGLYTWFEMRRSRASASA